MLNCSGFLPFSETHQLVLEVGSGSGRFTEQAAMTGATVVSMDYSYAVEANYASNGHQSNVLIVQGDIYAMPFRERFFDKLFFFGVLQHTPDVKKSFMALPRHLKTGGCMAVDVYRKHRWIRQLLATKYWVRPFTKHLPPERLYNATSSYVRLMWPLAKLIHKLPLGKSMNWALLIADYRDRYELSEDILMEWAILDTFDMLSPAYDLPQMLDTFKQWFEEAELKNVDVHYGYNGIEGRGSRG